MNTTSNFIDSNDKIGNDLNQYKDSKLISENSSNKDIKNESSSALWNLINSFSRNLFLKNKSKEKNIVENDEKENINNVNCDENIKFIDSPFPEELKKEEIDLYNKFMTRNNNSNLNPNIYKLPLHSSKRHNKILRSSSDSMNSYDSDSSEDSISDMNQPFYMPFYSRDSLNNTLTNEKSMNNLAPTQLKNHKPTSIPIYTNEFEHHHKQMAETSYILSSSVLAMQFDHTLTFSPSSENLYDHRHGLNTTPIKENESMSFEDFNDLKEKPSDGLLGSLRESKNLHFSGDFDETNHLNISDFEESNRINNYLNISVDYCDKYINNSKANKTNSGISEKKLVHGDLIDPQNNIEIITNGIPIATLHASVADRKVIENELIKEVIDGNLSEDLNNKKLSTSPFSVHSVHSIQSNRLSSSPEGSSSLSSKRSNNSISSIKKKDHQSHDNYTIDEVVHHYEKRHNSEGSADKRNNKFCSKCKNDIRCLSPSGAMPCCSCRNDIRTISPKLASSSPKSFTSTHPNHKKSLSSDIAVHSISKESTENHALFNKNTNVYNAMNQTSLDDIKFSKNTNVFNAIASPITTLPLEKVREMKEVISKKVPVEIKDDNRVIAHQIANPSAPIKTIKVMSKNQTVLKDMEHLEDESFNINGNSSSAAPVTNKLDKNTGNLDLTNVNTSSLIHAIQNDSILVNKTTCNANPSPNVNSTNAINPISEETNNNNNNNNNNNSKDNKYTQNEVSTFSHLSNTVVIERPSDHDQLVKPAIDTNFLMASKYDSTIMDEKLSVPEEDAILTNPINLLLNESSVTSPKESAVQASSSFETPSTSNSKKTSTVESPINISTTKDNKISSHYLNQNEKFIDTFNYIEIPPSTKHKKRVSVSIDQESTEKVLSNTFSGLDDEKEKEKQEAKKEVVKSLSSEEISREIDKEYRKIQAQIKNDIENNSTHDDLESEISILSPYSPNNINILEQEVSLESAIPIRSAVVTECSQSPFSMTEGKHKGTRSRARSRAQSLNHLRNRSFSGKLGLGSFGLGLANLTNLTENGELAITEDNIYLYNLENDASLDGLSTVSSNLSINLK
ncbi:hypothetical protein BCR36DRAFT_396631 [Piromyces finnis]|uniref:Uncharacterized protein n=1 Tax=Piromyces finnis TaxID=1754191 RepID=A0A1Y1VDL5_9FUNG|nr:hypothetical protein BCR36DRAFT_396631 [Piromyces finnis]|eukprot:ORX53393.1 hypothetical protein BCR36DRAFT_396631 [Piromyces finnis]